MKIRNRLVLPLIVGLIGSASYAQAQEKEKTMYMVSDAHLDTQWNWDVQTTIKEYLKSTLDDNFALFQKYPNYKFNFEGAIKYMWFKEYYPEKWDMLKKYIDNGQWNICGSSLDAIDIIVPSTESQIRNILIGQTYYKKEFGKKSNDIFLPDCFGFGYTLPTISSHCGLIGFSTQKLSWGGILTPFKVGGWKGVDGSRIMAAADAGGYGERFDEDLTVRKEFNDWIEMTNKATKGKHNFGVRYYGTGDMGGGPTDRSVECIEQAIKKGGPIKIESIAVTDLYKKYFPVLDDFPQYDGELIMTAHGTGCYTSRTMMKRWNRNNEILADAAEKSAVMADWMGGLKYPKAELDQAFIRMIWHQFHDDLTGTSIMKAYTFSNNDEVIAQDKFSNVLNTSVGASARALDTKTKGTPVVVYNSLSIDRNDAVEATINLSKPASFVQVFDKTGNEVPSQVIESNGKQVKIVFAASVKPLGYEVYDVRPSKKATVIASSMKISDKMLENDVYKVSIDANGDISSIIDKENGGKELLASPVRLALMDNEPRFWCSWEVGYKTVENKPRAYVDGKPVISIVEQGPVRNKLKITRQKDGSNFIQYITLTNTGSQKRIDIENDVDWHTLKTLLKAEFKLTVNNPEATYDLGIGVIKRPNNTAVRYEVPAQQWADLTSKDNAYGVSILSINKYGWDKPNDNTLRLSLIHSPAAPDDNKSYAFQEFQDLGENHFTFSIFGHAKNPLEAASTWQAAQLNQPLMAFETTKHEGTIGKSFSLLNIESSQVALKTLKKAEEGDYYVLRFYETQGKSANNVKVNFAANIVEAKELNGIEEVIADANFSGKTLTVNMTKFQPKTYRVKLADAPATLTSPECKTLSLPYNVDVITSNNDKKDGDFDGKSNSYVAELIPEKIVADGIEFAIGPKADGKMNALKCAGNKISIPTGYKKLYILAASTDLNGTTADFRVGKNAYSFHVPYFSHFVGEAKGYQVVAGDTTIYPSIYKPENIAWTGNHMHNGVKNADEAYIFTYLFKYCIVLPKSATELILPDNGNMTVLAVTVANNENDNTTPAAEYKVFQVSDKVTAPVVKKEPKLSEGKTATASGEMNESENAAKALDGDLYTKWCQNEETDKWLAIDLGQPMKIAEWFVKHAGYESENYITKNFKFQKLVGDQWVDVDFVADNKMNTTDRKVVPFTAQKVRLFIPLAGNDSAARINEFHVYGE